MQSDQQNFPQNPGLPNPHASLLFGQDVDFQPTRDCPRNFIIFDRTNNHSQIMYNPGLNLGAPYFPDTTLVQKDGFAPREPFSFTEEDSADIDMLLSFEDEEYEDDDEEVSTARTQGNDASDTCDSKGSERKRDKMKKMVKSLRGIVPGGDEMSTVDVLDEAVKYLKSLKVEMQKIGLGNLTR